MYCITKQYFDVLIIPLLPMQCVTIEHEGKTYEASEEPLSLTLPTPSPSELVLHFHGHYGEPSLSISPVPGSHLYSMIYNPLSREWGVKEE